MIERLTDQQYADLVAVIDGKAPRDPHGLMREGLIEPITQDNLQDEFRYRLTGDGRRHYTQFREHAGTGSAHLQ